MGQIQKIKLITMPPFENYGTCLQSYALNAVLRKMGHDVEFIYKSGANPLLLGKLLMARAAKALLPESTFKKLQKRRRQNLKIKSETKSTSMNISELPNQPMLSFCSRLPGYKLIDKAYTCCLSKRWKRVYKFAYEDRNYKMRRIYTHKEYEAVTAEADMFITGSDQIWNWSFEVSPMYFVEFGGDKKRIAYSSSISQPDFPKQFEQRIKQDLLKFKHIGVREQSSVNLLNKLLGRTDVRLVVDPVFLLSVSEWTEFGKKARLKFQPPQKYIFCYFVNEKPREAYKQMIQDVQKFTGINEVITMKYYSWVLGPEEGRFYNDGGPYEWVYLLQHSSYICTDSFHATAFALKFKKDFVHALRSFDTEDSSSQNIRIYDILGRYALSYKLYTASAGTEWQQPVDYDRVTPLIEAEIKDSLEFLRYEIES